MIRQTSIAVYHQIRDEVLLSKQRFNTYSVLFQHGPLTASELFVKAKQEYGEALRDNYQKRLPELRDLGVVQELGTTICSVTKREVILWDVTNDVPKLRRDVQISYKALLSRAREELKWAVEKVNVKSEAGKLWQKRSLAIIDCIETRLSTKIKDYK